MKYIRKFSSASEANIFGTQGLFSPHLNIVNVTSQSPTVNLCKVDTEKFTAEFDDNGHMINIRAISDAEILYTSTDGNIVIPNTTSGFGATYVSNIYENGKGVITFDGDITTIPTNAFRNKSTLETFSMPQKITSLGNLAFGNCRSLTYVKFSDAITYIGVQCFYPCPLMNTDALPKNLITLADSAFAECSSLDVPKLPDGLINLGGAFGRCSNLKLKKIPNSVTVLGRGAFRWCSNLLLETLPVNLTTIGDLSLADCSKIKLTIIPNTVTSIGQESFVRCVSIPSLTINRIEPPNLNSTSFNGTSFPIYVPAEAVEIYKSATNWSVYANRIFPILE